MTTNHISNNKIFPMTTNHMSNNQYFPMNTNQMSNNNKNIFPWPKISCPTKIFHDQSSMSNTKIHTTTKFFHTHTHKNFPCLKNKTYTLQQIFYIHQKWICSTKPIQQIFHNFIVPKNSSQNSFNNTTCYIHCQIPWVTNIVQVTPCQKTQQFKNIPKAKITTWSTMQCPKFQQEQTIAKWQCLNTKLSMKNEINKFPNKEIKNKIK